MISPCSPQHWWCRVTFKKLSNPSVTCQSARLHGYSLKVCLQKASLNMKWSTTKWLQLFCHYYYTAQQALSYWDSVTCILTNFIWWFLIWKQVLYCHWKYTFYMFISTFFYQIWLWACENILNEQYHGNLNTSMMGDFCWFFAKRDGRCANSLLTRPYDV